MNGRVKTMEAKWSYHLVASSGVTLRVKGPSREPVTVWWSNHLQLAKTGALRQKSRHGGGQR